MIDIFDNFVPEKYFKPLQETIIGQNFPWFYNDYKVLEGDGIGQFIHNFYDHNEITSSFYPLVKPIINSIHGKDREVVLVRIKANFQPVDKEQTKTPFHIDTMPYPVPENRLSELENRITAILYITTNNGLTVFENGDKVMNVNTVESEANRMIVFPAGTPHASISATDNKRIVLNMNFY